MKEVELFKAIGDCYKKKKKKSRNRKLSLNLSTI